MLGAWNFNKKGDDTMKKWIVIIPVIIVAAVAVFAASQRLVEHKIDSLESITPDKVIYYVSCYNPDKKIADFQGSDFFKQISGSELYKKFLQPAINQIKSKVPSLSELLKKDVSLVVLSMGNIAPGNSQINQMKLGDFLFLTRVDIDTRGKIKKSLDDFYLSLGQKNKIKHNYYSGVKITNYQLADPQIMVYCAYLSDVVLLANNIDSIKKSIDLYRNKSKSNLLSNVNFQKLLPKIKKDSLFWLYGDNKYYYQELLRAYSYDALKSSSMKDGKSVDPLLKMKPFMNMMNVLEGYVCYANYDELKKGIELKVYQAFDRSVDEENFMSIIAYSHAMDKGLFNLTPNDIIAFLGGNQDLKGYWEIIKKFGSSMDEMMKSQAISDPKYSEYKDQISAMSFDNNIKMLEGFLGVSIEKDILEPLGNNAAAVFVGLEDVEISTEETPAQSNKKSTTIVFPKIYCFAELEDKAKIEKVMQDMSAHIVDTLNQLFQLQETLTKKTTQAASPEGDDKNNPPQETPEQKKQMLNIKTDNYGGAVITSIEISMPALAFLKINYCILDKYIILSLSPDLTKEIIDVYQGKKSNFNSSLNFKEIQGRSMADYSNIIFFDFRKMLGNIRASKSFIDMESNLDKISGGNFTKANLDSILDILSNIYSVTFSNKSIDSGALESSCYIEVKGL